MNYILLFIVLTGACIYLLFGNDLSQQWFEGNATLVNILVAIIGVVAGVLSLLLALRGRSSEVLTEKYNTVKNVKVSGKHNKLEIKQNNDK